MRIGIYNEPSGSFGGSEYVVTVLAHALSERHQVEIVHHNHTLTLDQLAELSGLDVSAVRLRLISRQAPPDPWFPSGVRNLRRRYLAEIGWHADLSRPYDLFINSAHNLPPICHASTGVLLTLFPLQDRMMLWAYDVAPNVAPNGLMLKKRVKHLYYNWLWQKRFDSYQHKLSISAYTRKWTKAFWGIDSDVLYPPVDTRFEPAPKANFVLSVGRFSTQSHSKRQLEMMTTYRDMRRTPLEDWCYYCVGGLLNHPADHAYFDEVKRLAAECGAHVIPNIARAELRRLFAGAKIFWHAAGYAGDETTNPYQAEHFGISTVEAMAAGSVPIVYDHGGQSEIVEHGCSGYLWRTLDELRNYTGRLVSDEALRAQMAAAARQRAARFAREAFLDNFARLVPSVSSALRCA
jgi:glycosyltransferase involved in cell wall biosynthesis